MNPVQLLHQAILALAAYVKAEPDPADRQVAQQCLANLVPLAGKDAGEGEAGQQQGPPSPFGGQQGPPSLVRAAAGR